MPPERRSKFEELKEIFLSKHPKDRTPGLFKVEHEGTRMVCLSSKCYYTDDGTLGNDIDCQECHRFESGLCGKCAQKAHISAKGVSKKTNQLTFDLYRSTLTTHKPSTTVQRGFTVRDNEVVTFEQEKQGLSPLYFKRVVLQDGVCTVPLDL